VVYGTKNYLTLKVQKLLRLVLCIIILCNWQHSIQVKSNKLYPVYFSWNEDFYSSKIVFIRVPSANNSISGIKQKNKYFIINPSDKWKAYSTLIDTFSELSTTGNIYWSGTCRSLHTSQYGNTIMGRIVIKL